MKNSILAVAIFVIFPLLIFSCQTEDDDILTEPTITTDTIVVHIVDTSVQNIGTLTKCIDTLHIIDTLPDVDTLSIIDTVKPIVVQTIAILTYHKVEAEDSLAKYSTQVSVRKLENDFRWLADNGYTAILPRDLLTLDTFPQKAVIITFDDGYYNNYLYMFPLLKKYNLKAEISVIVNWITEERTNGWLTWDECREMSQSGLVEIGSHTYNLHNPTNGGSYIRGGVNGVGRAIGETDDDYIARITADLQKSKDIITERVGIEPVTFAYPYGENTSFIDKYISDMFSVTTLTNNGKFNPKADLHLLPRNTITMDTKLGNVLGR